MAGWQDDPVVNASSGGGGWQSDPVVGGSSSDADPGSFLQRTASTGTLGASDWAIAGVEGKSHQDILNENKAYAQNHPWRATAADLLGYGGLTAATGGLGAEAAVARAGLTGMPALLARGGLESAIAGGGSSMIRDPTDPVGALEEAGVSGAIGAGLGGVIGNRARELGPALERAQAAGGAAGGGLPSARAALSDFFASENKPPAPVGQAVLEANRDALYTGLKATPVDAQPVAKILDDGIQGLGASERSGLSSQFKDQYQTIADEVAKGGNSLNLSDVNSFRRQLGGAIRSDTDRIAYKTIGDQLASIYPEQQKAADLAHAAMSDVGWLSGRSPAEAAAGAADRVGNQAYIFSDAGRQAMQDLAAQAPGKIGAYINQGIDKLGGTAGAVIGSTIGSAFGHPIAGALAGPLVSDVVKGATSLVKNRGAIRAVKAAKAAIASGQPVSASQYQMAPWVSQAAQQYIRSQLASSGS